MWVATSEQRCTSVTTVLDPLHGDGYQFWSGIGANITMLGVIWHMYKDSRCHEIRCRRRAWRVHPKHGYPVCREHYPESPVKGT